MPLYQEIEPLARNARIPLTGLDRLLCERIESIRQETAQKSSEVDLPGLQLNVSFECEFFALPNTLPNTNRSFNQFPEAHDIIKDDNKELYAAAGCKLIPDEDQLYKVEAISIPHADGTFDSQPECIRHYFQFRDIAAKDLSSRFKDHRFRRFSEHLHFSFRKQHEPVATGLHQDFIELLEAALQAHWQAALPLAASSRNLVSSTPPENPDVAYLNKVGKRFSSEDWKNLNHFFVRCEEPERHHYEIRRTSPGPDGVTSNRLCHPMLLTQALLAASVNCALAALKDQDLKKELLGERDKIERAPCAFAKKLDRLSVDLCARDILKRPESLGETLAAGLAVTTLVRLAAADVQKETPAFTLSSFRDRSSRRSQGIRPTQPPSR